MAATRPKPFFDQVKAIMEQTPGLADIEPSREENYPEVNVTVDREKAALLGISEADVANTVLYSLNGNGQTDPIIYTDPQKPVAVEPKLYAVGEPGPDAPVLVTTNFSLSYYSVEGEVEASRVPPDWHGWLHHTYAEPPTRAPTRSGRWTTPRPHSTMPGHIGSTPVTPCARPRSRSSRPVRR